MIADVASANVTSVVHGVISGVPIPFPLPNPDGCRDSGLACPLQPDHAYTYQVSLPIKEEYPSLRVQIQWQLKDATGDDIVCFRIRAKIV